MDTENKSIGQYDVSRVPDFDTEDGVFHVYEGIPVGRTFSLQAYSDRAFYYFRGNEQNLKEGGTYRLDSDNPVFDVIYADENGMWRAFKGLVKFDKLNLESEVAEVSLSFEASSLYPSVPDIKFSGKGTFRKK